MRRLFLLCYGFFLCALDGSAAIVSLNPVADAFITGGSVDPSAGNPIANYGAAGALQVSASGSVKGEMQSLLKFDLSSAKASFDSTFGPGNWFIESITLQLGTNFGSSGAQPNNPIFNTVNAGAFVIDWLANDNWGEGSGTPALPFMPSNPPVDGVTFASLDSLLSAADRSLGTFIYAPAGNTGPTTPPASYSLSLNAGFLSDVAAGSLVSLRAYAGDAQVSYLFNSRSFPTDLNRPLLVISAVPEPSAGTLAAIAGLALCGSSRRRHARTE